MPRPNRGPYLKFLRKRGAWYIYWSEAGRTSERSTGTSDSGQAQIALAQFIQEWQRKQRPGGPRDPGEFPISEALALYGDEHAPTVADPARLGYAIAALVPFWGARMIGDITKETCRAYGRERDRAPGTIRKELTTLRSAINYAKSEGRLTYAPTVHLPAKPKGKDRWLTRNEAARLLNAARNGDPSTRPYLPLFILLALYSGGRKGALLSLRWPQIDLERQRLDLADPDKQATNKGRAKIPIPAHLLTFLRLARRRGSDLGYVLHRDGKKLGNMKRAFNSACEAAGMPEVTPHTLRHTCGTWLAQAGVPLDKIGAWLGHTDAQTTKLYAHHHPDYMGEALSALDRRKA